MSSGITLDSVPDGGPLQSYSAPYQTTLSSGKEEGQNPKEPDFKSAFWRSQQFRWRMADALWDGTEAMRAAGQAFLPKYKYEHDDMWKVRLGGAVLLNYYRKTIESYVGKPFGKPLEIPEDMPEPLKQWFEDVDGCGNSLDVVMQKGFEKGLCKGSIHALIDYPVAGEGETAADEADRLPILYLIQPEDLYGARAGVDEDDLDQVRIHECTTEPDGQYGEKQVRRMRVIEPDAWQLFEKDGKEWKEKSKGAISLGEIPFVTFLADAEGFMMSRPPLLDLAYKNVEHWQSSSDQRNILTVCRFPILVATGANPDEPLKPGPNTYFCLRDPQAKMSWLEIQGGSVNAGKADLDDLKEDMGVLGLTLFLQQKTGNPTATGKALDGAESVTELQRITMLYENFINECVYYAALWMELDAPDELPRIRINQDYVRLLPSDNNVAAIVAARNRGDLSRKAFLGELKRRGLLPVDFDIDADQEQLDSEGSIVGDGMPVKTGAAQKLLPGKKPAEKKPPEGSQ